MKEAAGKGHFVLVNLLSLALVYIKVGTKKGPTLIWFINVLIKKMLGTYPG